VEGLGLCAGVLSADSDGPLRENSHAAGLAGLYLYKNAEGEIIYVGKAKNLRARVRSYFLAASQANAKTGTLMREPSMWTTSRWPTSMRRWRLKIT